MDAVLTKIQNIGIIPVIAIEKEKDALPLGQALIAGGISCAEVTLRTATGLEAIAKMSRDCPDLLVGAGTVVSIEQCRQAVEAGAKFIVSPGFHAKLVRWCVERQIPVLPGCITPSEIMSAMELGLDTVKFFPANIYGGLSAMKALAEPFGGMRFVPTGGVNAQNLSEYMKAPFVAAVGGSWLCSKADIALGNFEKITALCQEAKRIALGFELAHIGINAGGADEARAICRDISEAFNFSIKEGHGSCFAGSAIEVMRREGSGAQGHIAIYTNQINRAIFDLESRGFRMNVDSAKYQQGRLIALYLEREFGGFTIHLLQK